MDGTPSCYLRYSWPLCKIGLPNLSPIVGTTITFLQDKTIFLLVHLCLRVAGQGEGGEVVDMGFLVLVQILVVLAPYANYVTSLATRLCNATAVLMFLFKVLLLPSLRPILLPHNKV